MSPFFNHFKDLASRPYFWVGAIMGIVLVGILNALFGSGTAFSIL
jgi:hypothetical protein